MPSFDVVSSPDLQEIDNAINNTKREVDNRFDFKNTNSTIERSDYSITIETTDNTKLNQFNEILKIILFVEKLTLNSFMLNLLKMPLEIELDKWLKFSMVSQKKMLKKLLPWLNHQK